MTHYHRTKEAPMEFEYEYTPLLSYNAFLRETKDSPSPSKEAFTPPGPATIEQDRHDLFVPKSYFSTPVQTNLDHTMSTQLGGISLGDDSFLSNPPTPNNSQEHDRQIKQEDSNEDDKTKALVPFHASPTLPSSDKNKIGSDVDANSTSTPIAERHTSYSPTTPDTIDQTMYPDHPSQDQQHSYHHPHLYPTTTYYHHDPIAHRKSLVYYFAGLIRIGCQLALFSVLLYIGFQFVLALNEDVALKIQVYESEFMEKHFICEQEYHRNQCQNNVRPAMVEPCRQWLQCLYTPAWIGKTKVLAETFAEIANGFVDTISLKTMIFGMTVIISTLWFTSSQNKPHTAPPAPYPPSFITTTSPSYYPPSTVD
ncbi:Di-sulfide bridge nucleocytoplasmic transport domain-containing protein [Halteromyces radiatus]|uniref:Di-sulfide bridge nucleocytoplasmic transport domain-containing protein n=1 Tax=Halteromyces radiatus TaxID=101107 RepID=UPI00221E547A|nr:Di-sulfide bridge nucleocytoplasmic transport domain-containing protein [Halteromyces radiatus]KAI8083077.1 Di-sulfide bridge nucleocytoplasmic transport domain-containing protein [Halteromyces radiatus]